MRDLTREQVVALSKSHTITSNAGRTFFAIEKDNFAALCTLALERLDMEPRPIAEAPKDVSEILAYWDDEWVKTYWVKRNGFEGWQLPSGRTVKAYAPETWRPTHFIPLSSLPKPKGT